MATILLYGDTVRYPAIRHEVPLEIIDPLLLVARDGEKLVLTSPLESDRIAQALPDAQLHLFDEFGLYELIDEGMPRDDAVLETVVRAVDAWGIEATAVPADLPVAVADRLRAAGVARVFTPKDFAITDVLDQVVDAIVEARAASS